MKSLRGSLFSPQNNHLKPFKKETKQNQKTVGSRDQIQSSFIFKKFHWARLAVNKNKNKTNKSRESMSMDIN